MRQAIVLNFDNHLTKHLPFQVRKVMPAPLTGAHLVAVSDAMLAELSIDKTTLEQTNFVEVFSGKILPEGGCYHAQAYAGHQFGQFVPQLGDGRAISLGEATTSNGNSWDIQLKGAGLTPFSRMGDGRAVLRSCIREFLASEAMSALGIPTTQALCIIGSNQDVYRETVEKGAVMTRMARSYIRFGHFEYWFHQGKKDELNQLADYCLAQYFTECLTADNPHLAMFERIIESTAIMIAKWQAHGFSHGVMNTDNMSILGLTIDYGPFGFLDEFNPQFICNHSDHSGRYAFEQQPGIGLWNLNALAVTFSDWLSAPEITKALEQYEPILVKHYLSLMQAKLGLSQWQESDHQLLGQWLGLMKQQGADYTNTFRRLNLIETDENNERIAPLKECFKKPEAIEPWLTDYKARLLDNDIGVEQRIETQNRHNAKYILRNYLAQQAITKAELGDYSEISQLQGILSRPFDEQAENEDYANPAPAWGKSLEISCSS